MWGRTVIVLLLLASAGPVWAGRVYRCESGDGAVSYVSKRPPGTTCRLLGQFRAGAVASSKAAKAVPPAPPLAELPSLPEGVVAPATPPGNAVPASAPAPAPVTPGPRLVRGQLYSFVDRNGVRNYTSVRPAGVPAAAVRTIAYSYIERCYACGVLPGVDFHRVRLNTDAYSGQIAAIAREAGVEEAIVRAVIHAESAFNPRAVSRAGALGLMQLMPDTARRFGVSDPFDAEQNIRGGVQYLAWLLKRYGGNLTLAAAGYNAGEGAVDRYGGVPPYDETQRYVQRVGVLVERYRGALREGGGPLRGGLSAR